MSVLSCLREVALVSIANFPARSGLADRHRWKALKWLGVDISKGIIFSGVSLPRGDAMHRVSIGKGTFINSGFTVGLGDFFTVSIGESCNIGPNASFQTASHDLVWVEKTGWGMKGASIAVGDRCWLGANVTILGGVSIGEGAVIAAGAVVNKDVAPFTLVGGVPAKFIKALK